MARAYTLGCVMNGGSRHAVVAMQAVAVVVVRGGHR